MGSLLSALKAAFCSINIWHVSSKQGLMIRPELLICYSVGSQIQCQLMQPARIKSDTISREQSLVTATKGPRRPVWSKNSPELALLPFSAVPLKLTLKPAQSFATCCSLIHPILLHRTLQLLFIALATVPRATCWDVPASGLECPGQPHFLSLQYTNLSC